MGDKLIGNCRMLEEIGQGGMAVVHRAVQTSLDRPVAIKELKAEFVRDEQVAQRFQREALSVAMLQHENIVHVYDYVKEGDAQYIIMEYVEGVNLYDLLARVDRLPPDVAAIIGLQLARALEYAHFRKIVHRDIKPSNIVISLLGEVKLMDFGIARAEALGDMTRPGIALGTPSYMSPEQIMGERVDSRSDVFSFGIVLYQMLTGRKPFAESDERTVMQAILKDGYVPARTIHADVPFSLNRVVNRCLRKRPESRYRTTEALRVALERYVSRQVRLNMCGRLVAFLHHRGLISEEQALTVLPHDILSAANLTRSDLSGPASLLAPVKKVAMAAVAGLMLFSAGASAVEWWPEGGFAREVQAAQAPGRLRVNVWPWARVFVDGRYVETTPFMYAIPLPAGRHVVELRNEHFEEERRAVDIQADRTYSFNIELKRRKGRR